jgi:hypothetical protein
MFQSWDIAFAPRYQLWGVRTEIVITARTLLVLRSNAKMGGSDKSLRKIEKTLIKLDHDQRSGDEYYLADLQQ